MSTDLPDPASREPVQGSAPGGHAGTGPAPDADEDEENPGTVGEAAGGEAAAAAGDAAGDAGGDGGGDGDGEDGQDRDDGAAAGGPDGGGAAAGDVGERWPGGRPAAAILLGVVLAAGLAVWTLVLIGGTLPTVSGSATARPATTLDAGGPPAPAATPTVRTVAQRGPDTAAPGSPQGRQAPTCVNGWQTPEVGADERREGLEAVTSEMQVTGDLQVVDLRYFTGQDGTRWWYVKAFLAQDLDFQGRWLVQRPPGGQGRILAVASYATDGLRSPDWYVFDGDGPPVTQPGLPGRWSGTPYDFVGGATGLIGGLPSDVRGCMAGT